MTQYVAFPRGINAGHPMKMAELRAVFESLGYEGVRTVLASGNVLFETKKTAEATLIRQIEKGAVGCVRRPDPCGDPHAGGAGASGEGAAVRQDPIRRDDASVRDVPQEETSAAGASERVEGYEVLGIVDRAVCSVVDLSGGTSPDLMRVLDKEFGNEVTTRSWNTVEKVLRASG